MARHWSPALALATAALAVGGCGGGAKPTAPPDPARTPPQFAARFAHLTGVRLEVERDPLGTRLAIPQRPDRYGRFGVYSLTWTRDASQRRIVLGHAKPDDRGISWERVGDGWSAAKPFGAHLVLEWTGGHRKVTGPKWDRLERAVRAAFSGQTSVLPAAEHPCRDANIDPLHGRAGGCAVAGLPVTSVEATGPVRTPAFTTRVLGAGTAATIGEPPLRAKGRFVLVAYTTRNSSPAPLRFLRLGLRIGARYFDADVGGGVFQRSRPFPIPPGASVRAEAAFDVPTALAARARRDGALVVPAARDELGDPAPDIAQAWIRLARAPEKLPASPRPPAAPGAQPTPHGPPPIPFTRGSGPPVGGAARRIYTAGTFFPIPSNFVAGGVPAGSRAGACRVPRPGRRDRDGLRAAARRETPGEPLRATRPQEVLLAECGRQGRWALFAWRTKPKGHGVTIHLDEFTRRRGRWVGTPKGTAPGCRLPDDAAAAWQIDISLCRRQRPQPPPSRGPSPGSPT